MVPVEACQSVDLGWGVDVSVELGRWLRHETDYW